MKYAIISDDTLVRSFQSGDSSSLSKLLRQNQSKVYGFILSKVQDSELAKDLLQDTFVKIIQSLKQNKYNEQGKFISWSLRIAHNIIIDHFRREKRLPKHENAHGMDVFDFIEDYCISHESKMINRQIFSELKELIASLPQDQKQIIHLRIFMGMSFKEIAEQTGVSINTALGRMRYAILNMRRSSENSDLYLLNA